MGVQGLERYITTTHPASCPRVSIAALAEKYRKATGRDSAVAVVDGGLVMYEKVSHQEQLYGGQFKQLAASMVDFACRLQDVGVTPVFYFKGAPSEGRLNVWEDRKKQQLARVQDAFDRIATWPPSKPKCGDRDAVAPKESNTDAGAGEPLRPAEPSEPSVKEAVSSSGDSAPEPLPPAPAAKTEEAAEREQKEASESQPQGEKLNEDPGQDQSKTPESQHSVVKSSEAQGDSSEPQPQVQEQSGDARADQESRHDWEQLKQAQEELQRLGYHARGFSRGRAAYSQRGGRSDFPQRGGRSDFSQQGGRSDFSQQGGRSDFPQQGGRSDFPQRGGRSDFPQRGRSDWRGAWRASRGAMGPRRGGRGARGYHQQGVRRAPRGNHDFILPSGAFICVKLALKRAGFEVRISVRELDVEMGQYCRRHGCFALLSRDTDFVAMETAHYYLSVAHLDQDMATLHFDRDAIARALGLRHRGHLPLLMAVLANGCVPASYLIPLHIKAAGTRLDQLSPSLSFRLEAVITRLGQLVKNRLSSMTTADAVLAILDKSLTEYSPELMTDFSKQLGFADSAAFREALRTQLEASLAAHDYTPWTDDALPRSSASSPEPAAPQAAPENSVKVLQLARVRHVALQFVSPHVLVLLEKRVWEDNCALEDPALPPGSCSTEALRPFRRRLYGVLFHEGASQDHGLGRVREFILPNQVAQGARLVPAEVEPQPLDAAAVPHPGLLSLWRGENMEDARWRLLGWCLCPSLGLAAADLPARLRALPCRHVLPAAALFLMRHCGALAASIRAAADRASRSVVPTPEAEASAVDPVESAPAAATSAVPAPEGQGRDASAVEEERAEVTSAESPTQEPSPAPAAPVVEFTPTSEEEVIRLFARTCVRVGKMTAAEIEQLPPPRPQRLAVHLAALFMRACTHLIVLNDALGAVVPVDEVQPASFFDGKLLHTLLMDDTSHEVDDGAVEAIVAAARCGDTACDACAPATDAALQEVEKALAQQHLSTEAEAACEE
ncbi:uncharacterized protein LOC117645848 isoform X2 [Thrips palmi]|uniref:Uncharacterized protein LOC117645848 isoform X2 n=1 Tax=Thrips palmi TaxID=161013 RepID=A0A6P8Z6A2_THRPL|nr:uncharacterized protein LOC117645848 isoform X2 [Thrips palmi]